MGWFPGKFKPPVDFLGGWKIGGVAVTATAAEINAAAAGQSPPSSDGLSGLRVARATWDFAVHGGAIKAHGLGVTLPNKAIVVGGFVDVATTCTTADGDSGTMALHVQSANDIVAAVAVSHGSAPWAAGRHAIVPKANTPESTSIKLTEAREITATIAGQVFTAGKVTVFLYYVIGN